MLIVEDEPALLQTLKRLYRQVFSALGFEDVTIVETSEPKEAKNLAKDAERNPYDFVSLDINLGVAEITGLDVLSAFKRFKSAWMIAVLTGVETETSADATLGKGIAGKIRKQLRCDAYTRFWPERLIVVEKPAPALSQEESAKLLRNRLEQVARLYLEIARQRYIFRPIEVQGLERIPAKKKGQKRQFFNTKTQHWQIRFNCGDIRTLPYRAGFKTIYKLLSLGPDESLTPEAALVIEPENEKSAAPPVVIESPGNNPFITFFETLKVPFNDLNPDEQERLVKITLGSKFREFAELRLLQDDNDLSAQESDRLEAITAELGVLVPVAEAFLEARKENSNSDSEQDDHQEVALRAALQQGQLHVGGAAYESNPGRRGFDSREGQNFRARKKRIVDYLRENGFADLAEHLEGYITSTGANWSYNPPTEIEWTL